MATKLNLSIDQGSDWSQQLTYLSEDGSNPIDLTGYTARLQIRESYEASDPPMLELTTENGGIELGDAAGTILITVTHAQSTDLVTTDGRAPYVYDLELVAGLGTVTRLIQGKVKVRREVTR